MHQIVKRFKYLSFFFGQNYYFFEKLKKVIDVFETKNMFSIIIKDKEMLTKTLVNALKTFAKKSKEKTYIENGEH